VRLGASQLILLVGSKNVLDPAGLPGTEEAEGGGVAMQEGRAPDGTYLSVAEEAADGDVTQVLLEDTGVEVGPLVEVLTAPQAGEEEGAGDDLFLQQGVLAAVE